MANMKQSLGCGKGACGLLWLACALAGTSTLGRAQNASEIILHNFAASMPYGASPSAGVIRDSAGNLYGTTYSGGAGNSGVVFKLDPAGKETVLHSFCSFTNCADGSSPQGGVIRDSAGNLYGTARNGGSYENNANVVYKLDPAGQETVLYTFTGGSDGSCPEGSVIRDSAGNLYGTTEAGGTVPSGCFSQSGCGVVYKLDAAGQETVLYSFTGGSDGGTPESGVILDSAGNLYGTTTSGGAAAGYGVVFKVDTSGHETVLYTFTGGADGSGRSSGVIRDSAGNLYGTAGGGAAGEGVVFKLEAAGQETVLYNFTGGNDGGYPSGGVVLDSAGSLFGTAYRGGSSFGSGAVYKLDTAGHEKVLYTFTGGADGSHPGTGVIRDSLGNLYGTTCCGGTSGGVVYKVDTARQETVLYGFPGAIGGSGPWAGVIRDSAGNLYGTTRSGGAANQGLAYKLDATGHETPLYSFTGGNDGGNPNGVVRDSAGNLYGTTRSGGKANEGAVYELDATGQETVLYSFTGGTDGGQPQAGVVRDSAGNLYGTTLSGGLEYGKGCLYSTAGCGVVFKLDTTGHETVLHSFTDGYDGGCPQAGVVLDSAGNLYGTAPFGCAGIGVVYKVDTAGQYSVLYTFTGGESPNGVVLDPAGNLYGTAYGGGVAGNGVVFKLDTAGHLTVLYAFTGGADGGYPYAGVVRDSAGNLYGATAGGGTGYGVVFEVSTAGQELVLYTFTGGAFLPFAGVIRDSAGNLYGTLPEGGKNGGGVVFKIKPQ
jgi:uncharacterized repeat protein (TIGR03803 family)